LIAVDSSTAVRSADNLRILSSHGVAVHVMHTGFGTFGRRNAIVNGLNRKIKALGDEFDLIHLQSPWVGSSIAIATRNKGVPLVMTPHEGFTHFDIRQSRLGHIKRLLLRRYGRCLAA